MDTFGTSEYTNDAVKNVIEEVFDLRPGEIISVLDLRRPIYENMACYGHVGRTDVDLPWKKIDKVNDIISLYITLYKMMDTGVERDIEPFYIIKFYLIQKCKNNLIFYL